jgi:ribosome-associated protein
VARKTDPAKTRALQAARWALEKNGVDPVLVHLTELCSFTDYVLIISGRSSRQVKAIADTILEGMRTDGLRPLGTEGLTEARWVLLDYGSVIVHVFLEELREHYGLESLWIEAPRVDIARSLAARSRVARATVDPS